MLQPILENILVHPEVERQAMELGVYIPPTNLVARIEPKSVLDRHGRHWGHITKFDGEGNATV